MVIGHRDTVSQLKTELPPVTLLAGPDSVGKTTLAREVMAHHGLIGLRLLEVSRLEPDRVPQVAGYVSTSGRKGVLIQLDGATPSAVTALLKPLEEPPPEVSFLLVASTSVPLTVASRAQVYRVGYLATREVAAVLVALRGLTEAQAMDVAKRSGGQVSTALRLLKTGDGRGPVLSVLKAVAQGDEALFMHTVSGKRLARIGGREVRVDTMDRAQLDLLKAWAVEARTGCWRQFSAAESYGLDRDPTVIDRVLTVTSRVSRPKVAVRAALLPLVWSRA